MDCPFVCGSGKSTANIRQNVCYSDSMCIGSRCILARRRVAMRRPLGQWTVIGVPLLAFLVSLLSLKYGHNQRFLINLISVIDF